ncbi:hypothetical protein K457DRAFT_16479 [Linnemannia elongata AG-77]|uniref:Uncharacterized protein n=1 Tax=Linnemannia elongata AG-77 TaxID=1314771 RepID=A0A197K6Y3_9FUNG|nr:hypothetical protein K457DRAFT_16479 [Linnemannia elongata AG-77]
MHFSSAFFVAAAFVAALPFADVARAVDPNDPVVKACIRKCDVAQATDFEAAVKTYLNPKDKQRLSVIKWATVYRAEAGIGLNACNNKCQVKLSYAAEKCVKKFPVTDSDARLLCNTPPVEAERKCEDRCSKVSRKCSEKCFLKANTDWEPCVTEHKDPIDPKRIQCIKDVQNAYVNNNICDTYSNIMQLRTASLIAVVGMLTVTLTTVNAQGDPVCIKRCDEAFSAPLGDCILAHPKKPKHPERKQCVDDAYYQWVDCLENCYE